jgi:hypothetical protein
MACNPSKAVAIPQQFQQHNPDPAHQQFNFENQVKQRLNQGETPPPNPANAVGNFDEESDMIGVLKIKDGLFICDELGA